MCSLAAGPYTELFEITRPSFESFAVHHGRDLVVGHDDVAGERPPGWGKLALVRELLDHYAEVVWIDADAVIVDGRDDPCQFLDRVRPIGVSFHRYDGMEIPNLGVMALRSCTWTKRLVERMWQTPLGEHPWMDNASFLTLMGYELDHPSRVTRRTTPTSLRVRELDLTWNSTPQCPARRPRIEHFPALAHEERRVAMAAAARRAWLCP